MQGGINQILEHAFPENVCVSEASEEHFPCFLRGICITCSCDFLHLKIKDFVMHFITFYNLIPLVLKQRLLCIQSNMKYEISM